MPEPPLDDLAGGGWAEEQQEVVHQVEAGDGDQRHEPEPHEHVDLLVNHVDGQHAQRVVSLDGPCTCRYTGSSRESVQKYCIFNPLI